MGIKNALSLFFLAVGGFLLLVGVIQGVGTIVFLSRAESTQATIIDYEIVENAAPFMASASSGLLYYPVLRFETPGGAVSTFTGDQGQRSRPYEVGSRVGVLYEPDLENSRVADFWGLWGRVVIFAGLGAVFAFLGFLTPFGFSRAGRQNPFDREPEV